MCALCFRRRLSSRCQEMDGTISDQQTKLTALERTKARFVSEIEDLTVNLENVSTGRSPV